ncbi:MAG: hypothetical protein FD134_2121 [Gallionellaceae bacterium]|nr:MAG: hypothetical protein FD134_2121 [Gallionellaceae bacterium]
MPSRRMLGQIALARQPRFWAAVIAAVAVGQIEQPVYAFLYGFAVDGHQGFSPECMFELLVSYESTLHIF